MSPSTYVGLFRSGYCFAVQAFIPRMRSQLRTPVSLLEARVSQWFPPKEHQHRHSIREG